MSAYLYATSYLLTATDPLNIHAHRIDERGSWLVSILHLQRGRVCMAQGSFWLSL